ncbi:MAG TPA: hypothetical protein VGP28_04520 [Methylocella sp.]|jgi:hypothetical protein|nr:hypothetical protein [Methylocella sp.]
MSPDLFDLWFAEFGDAWLTSNEVVSRATPDLRTALSGLIGSQASAFQISELLAKLPDTSNGWLLKRGSRDGLRTWRVIRASEDEPRAAPQQALVPSEPLDPITPAEMLASNLTISLRRQAELLAQPFDADNLQRSRLIADVAAQTLNAALRASESILRPPRDQNRAPSARLLEAVARADREGD